MQIKLVNRSDYREGYANSVQLRGNLWDFFLTFGVMDQSSPESVSVQNFQGVYLSPQTAKVLLNILQQHVAQYEATFGELHLEAKPQGGVIQ
jgi:flagellar protein FlaG